MARHVSSHRLAAALAYHLTRVAPASYHVRAQGAAVHMYDGDERDPIITLPPVEIAKLMAGGEATAARQAMA